jgi:hypothetical protein
MDIFPFLTIIIQDIEKKSIKQRKKQRKNGRKMEEKGLIDHPRQTFHTDIIFLQ